MQKCMDTQHCWQHRMGRSLAAQNNHLILNAQAQKGFIPFDSLFVADPGEYCPQVSAAFQFFSQHRELAQCDIV